MLEKLKKPALIEKILGNLKKMIIKLENLVKAIYIRRTLNKEKQLENFERLVYKIETTCKLRRNIKNIFLSILNRFILIEYS